MHQPYQDILDEITQWIRDAHSSYEDTRSSFPSDCASAGPDGRRTSEFCTCVAKPLWWDANGVPRFAAHTPLLCPDIGATEVILMQIACQNCAKEFAVQMSWDRMDALKRFQPQRHMMTNEDFERQVVTSSLSYQIAGRGPHYGDPPYHPSCQAGNTMNVWDLRILEFWRRTEKTIEYVRIPELEVPLPDLTVTERVGPS